MNKARLETLINDYSAQNLGDLLYEAGFEAKPQSLSSIVPPDALFTECFKIGELKTADNQKILVVETKVANDLSERSSRKRQFDIGKKILQSNNSYIAGLFVFYDEKKNFRLSLVHPKFEGTRRSYNSFKRYTFYVNPAHSNKTFINQFVNASFRTLDSIKEVFSVAKVTYDFFKEYKRLFEQIVEHIKLDGHFPKFAEQNGIAVNDVAKKLLGQIVFLYFLQRKGWLGAQKSQHVSKGDQNFLRTLFNKAKEAESGHPDSQINFFNDYLEYLFYDALNKPVTDSATSCYRQRFDCQIPFLNGGLFEPIPEYKWQDRFLQIPDDIFSNKKETGVLDIFDSYNFTIDENSADDQEVSVDPEMLGKVFENLLEENLRKGTGSFYTPREIVQYMVTESLRQYLRDKTDISDEKIASVLEEYHNECEVSEDEAEKIDTVLKHVRVVDPACGSGAFLVGLLQEIAHIRHYCQRCYHTEPQTYYQIKKEIIRDSVYGVDLDGGAVDIARLRFWLSMVVDHDIAIDDIEPLPNLDYKLMQGNSLLEDMYVGDIKIKLDFESGKKIDRRTKQGRMFDAGEEELETQTLGFSEETGERIAEKLVRHHNEFFIEKDPTKKTVLKKKIDSLESELIVAGHDDALNALESQLRNSQGDGEKRKIKERIEQVKASKENWLKFKVRPYFPWRLHFSEVFDAGGFDTVIGNPPYFQLQKHKSISGELERVGYKTFSKSGDIYCVFYELGVKILKDGGVLSYITSNSWMQTKYGGLLRKFLVEETNPKLLLNFKDSQVFNTAVVESNILITKKEPYTNDLFAADITLTQSNQDSLKEYFQQEKVLVQDLSNSGWSIATSEVSTLLTKLRNTNKTLKELDYKICIGIINGLNEAFIIDSPTRDKLIEIDSKSSEIIKPLLRGRDVSKYHHEWNNFWLINSHNGIKDEIDRIDVEVEYPAIYQHLKKYEDELEVRRNRGYHWTNLRNCNYFRDFEKPKIIWGELSDKPKFAIDFEGFYPEATLFAMTGENLKYILAILNSSVALWFFQQITTSSGMGTSRWKKYKIEQIPIPQPEVSVMNDIANLVDEVTDLLNIKNAEEAASVVSLIDQKVMDLYGLSEEEKKLISNK